MKLQVHIDGLRSGAVNMSTDTRLLEEHQPGDDPILRIYRWHPAAVSYGHHQSESDFAQEIIAQEGWGLVRRPTGGRAILHAEELTYAVIGTSPSDLFGGSLHDTYMKINQALISFLEKLGLAPDISSGESLTEARGAVCFQSAGQHEITVSGRKIIGSAQRRRGEVFLQHGSILVGSDHVDLLKVLPKVENTSGRRDALLSATTDLNRELGCHADTTNYEHWSQDLVMSFAEAFDLEVSDLGPSS